MTGYIILGVVALLVVIIIIWLSSTYNKFISLRNKCEEAFSTMDVYLKKRYDLIPNFVETVKGYATHEKETLENVISARNKAMSSPNSDDRIQNENILQGTLKSLFALTESYPDLKANANFLELQKQLQMIEEDIANARKYYNAVINSFNVAIEVFPSNILANMFRFSRKPLYEVTQETERENVNVKF